MIKRKMVGYKLSDSGKMVFFREKWPFFPEFANYYVLEDSKINFLFYSGEYTIDHYFYRAVNSAL